MEESIEITASEKEKKTLKEKKVQEHFKEKNKETLQGTRKEKKSARSESWNYRLLTALHIAESYNIEIILPHIYRRARR